MKLIQFLKLVFTHCHTIARSLVLVFTHCHTIARSLVLVFTHCHTIVRSPLLLGLQFLDPVGVQFIANSGSISLQILAVKVTNPFIFPYARQLWFSSLALRFTACFTRICRSLTNPRLQVSRGD
jgi:hypothetical protein